MFLEDMVTRRMKNMGEGRQAAVMAIKSYLCQHFVYGVDQYCHTMVACRLREKQLVQGDRLKKRCKLWVPIWQKEVGWTPEAG